MVTSSVVSDYVDATAGSATVGTAIDKLEVGTAERLIVIPMPGNMVRFAKYTIKGL